MLLLYRTRFLSPNSRRREEFLSRHCRRAVSESLDQPLGVIARNETSDDHSRLVERSLSVRMKRSITPLHCGSPTNEGL
jgi:hypothetical protein